MMQKFRMYCGSIVIYLLGCSLRPWFAERRAAKRARGTRALEPRLSNHRVCHSLQHWASGVRRVRRLLPAKMPVSPWNSLNGPRLSPAKPFRCRCQENFAAFACCDTLTMSFNRVSDLGDTMAYDSHQKAAEFHMLAAHAHQAAAAHHGKEDHLTAHEQSRQAMEYASKAFEFSKQAHDESSVIFKKHEKKA